MTEKLKKLVLISFKDLKGIYKDKGKLISDKELELDVTTNQRLHPDTICMIQTVKGQRVVFTESPVGPLIGVGRDC